MVLLPESCFPSISPSLPHFPLSASLCDSLSELPPLSQPPLSFPPSLFLSKSLSFSLFSQLHISIHFLSYLIFLSPPPSHHLSSSLHSSHLSLSLPASISLHLSSPCVSISLSSTSLLFYLSSLLHLSLPLCIPLTLRLSSSLHLCLMWGRSEILGSLGPV